MIICDRFFEWMIIMYKDSIGYVGFIFKNGKIIFIVKDSFVVRNGFFMEYNICEING